MKKLNILLIIIVATFLRFWMLNSYPAFNADEAALGYNAYSLIQTGKDEHGNSWPVHFQSFNDYKPGGYVYLIIPFIKFFGLNEWSVRFPGALLGVVTVYLIYLFVNSLNISKNIKIRNFEFTLGEVAALFLAISPWHIHFSRGGWEVNVATFLILLGVYLFLKFVNDSKYRNLILSLVSFVLSLYVYHSARLITPLLGLGLVLIYWNELQINKRLKKYLLSSILFFVLLIPLILDFTKGAVGSRVAGVGLFADTGPHSRIEEQRTEHGDFRSITARVIHNKLVNYGLAFLENWGEHYHGLFLFLSGDDIQRNKVPETGQMYMYDLLLVAVGLVYLIKKIENKNVKLVMYWLLIAPVAAALTFQSPHALRAQNMVIPLVIISASGFMSLVDWIMNKKYNLLLPVMLFVIALSFLRYEHMYWTHMSKEYPYSSQYGVKELVEYIAADNGKHRDIVVTDRYDQPYILYLFYTKYNPFNFQNGHTLTAKDGYGFSTVRDFSNLHFYSVKFEEMRNKYPNSLIVGTPEEIPDEANIVKKIYGTNGFEYFDIVAN